MKARPSFLIGFWLAGASVVVLLGLSGCGSSFALRIVDERAGEMYISYSKSTAVKVGDVFAVYETVVHSGGSSGGGHQHGSSGEQSSHLTYAWGKQKGDYDFQFRPKHIIFHS
jgi:hypothetical protein